MLKSSTKPGNIKFLTPVFSGNCIVRYIRPTDVAIVTGISPPPFPRTPNISHLKNSTVMGFVASVVLAAIEVMSPALPSFV